MSAVVAVTIVFGKPGNAEGWVSEEELTGLPDVGLPVRIRLEGDNGQRGVIEGQVYRAWGDEDDAAGILVYAGTSLPSATTREVLQGAGWAPLSQEMVLWLAGTVQDSPVVAAKHEVNLIIENGPDGQMCVYRQVLTPSDPAIPFFGQRMRANFLDDEPTGNVDALFAGYDELPESHGGEVNDEEIVAFLFGDDDDLADLDDDKWRALQEDESASVDALITSHNAGLDARESGLPVVVIYAAVVEIGVARLAFYTSGAGGLTDEDFILSGWEKVAVPGRFDPQGFGLDRRVDLAKRTHVIYQTGPFGDIHLGDWWIDNPQDITDVDRQYLPPHLMELALGVRDLDSLEDIIQRWGPDAT